MNTTNATCKVCGFTSYIGPPKIGVVVNDPEKVSRRETLILCWYLRLVWFL